MKTSPGSRFFWAIAFAFSPLLLRADIAPTEYVGYGISPVEARGVRMVSAKVDITWGQPCQLTAVFVMENQTALPVEIQLGFPMTDPKARAKLPSDLRFDFDGVSLKATSITVDSNPKNKPDYSTWFRCHHTFRPGTTTVNVKTSLPASLDYGFPFRERLFYCIETGGSWKDSIGSEEVAIHFPAPVTKEQIIEARPPNYQVEGKSVRWIFSNFEPRGGDHDIEITYLRPDVIATLAKIRAEVAHEPENPSLILKLVRNLVALGPHKGNAPYPPGNLTKSELNAVLSRNHAVGS